MLLVFLSGFHRPGSTGPIEKLKLGVMREKSGSQFLHTVNSMFSQVWVLDNDGCFLKTAYITMQLSFGLYYKEMYACVRICIRYFCNGFFPSLRPSSLETQGQIVGARESLNGRKNKARRKVKNGEKSSWGQCLARPVPNGRRSRFWLAPEKHKFSGTNQKPERQRSFGTGLIIKTLSPGALLAILYFSLCLIFLLV